MIFHYINNEGSNYYECNGFDKYKLISVILIVVFSLLLIKPILPYKYYLGYDSFRNEPTVDFLRQNDVDTLDLLEEKSIAFPGFYLFLLVLDNCSTICIHQITRFGGPFMLAMVSLWLFFTLFYKVKSKSSLIFPFLFIITPYTMQRFLMAIRENFSLILLSFYIYLLFRWIKDQDKGWLLASAVFGCIVGVHPLTSLFLIAFTALAAVYYRKLELIILAFIGVVINFPLLVTISPWTLFFIRTIISTLTNTAIEPAFWLSKTRNNSSWGRVLSWSDVPLIQKILWIPGTLFLAKYWNKQKEMLLLSFSFVIVICATLMTESLGYSFTTVRLLLDLSIISCLIAGLGLIYIEESISFEITYRINIFQRQYSHQIKNSIGLIILSFIVLANIQTPLLFHKGAPYSFYEVSSILNLSEKYQNKEGVFIISMSEKRGLLEYGGFEPYYQENKRISDLFNASDLTQVTNEIVGIQRGTTNILVYITDFNLYVLRDRYPLLRSLSDDQLVYDDDTVNVYRIY
ncbi:MAG: hypothetical protein ACTSVB_02585 [Candidatus Heimdallarchaeaceae archaeon]